MSPAEIRYICSIRRSFPRNVDTAYIRQVAHMLAVTMGRNVDFLEEKLTDTQLCMGISTALQNKIVAFVPEEEITFPTVDGYPYSSNSTWNSCIRGQRMTLDAYTDLDESGRKVTCADFRTGDWYRHPDLAIYFRFNRETKEIFLPAPYVARPLTATL